MQTISQLARRFGLSRSTLLHYSRIGLLRPARRTAAGYRLYGEADMRRLEAICRYREAGLGLREIQQLLDGGSGRTVELLERRLEELNGEIAALREQQRLVVALLKNPSRLGSARALDKAAWVALLRSTGLSEEDMRRWHVEFERLSPLGHQDFLESLGIPAPEIDAIRGWSRAARAGG
ncbi:MAG: MerR family transcriptional regulator [Deltaproteobacteria bacterium]|nr:MerR family transcriptional regulator [Deltaproteobacteria bacterium]